MSEFRALIEEMVAKGVDPIDAADIVHRATMLGAASAPKKRTPGALRQERYRETTIAKRMPDHEWYPLVGKIIARDGGKCAYCGTTEKLGADHILPLSRGGDNDPSNLAACCESCNKSKGGRTVEEWKSGKGPRHGSVTVTQMTPDDAPPALDKEKVGPKEIKPTPLSPPSGGHSSAAEIDQAIEAYSEMAARCGLAVPRAITPQRRRKIAAVLRLHGMALWLEAVARVEGSEFCRGKNDRGWRAHLDFLLQSNSFMGLIEGKYGGEPSAKTGEEFCSDDWPNTRFLVTRYRSEKGTDPPRAIIGGKAGFNLPAEWVALSKQHQVQHA